MAANGPNERNLDPGSRLILEELRDLRLEMRADRRKADEERQRSDEGRRRFDEAWRQEWRRSNEEWRQERLLADEERRQERLRSDEALREERRQSDERFERVMRDFRRDSARREVATQKAFKDIRTVGLSIVKTLNYHTRILERIDRKLGAWGNGRPGRENGGGRRPRK